MSTATVFNLTLFSNIFRTKEARQAFSKRSYVANLIKAECAPTKAKKAKGIVPASTAAVLRKHYNGATTQDIVDLALVLQIKTGLKIVKHLLYKVTSTLEKMSAAYRDMPMAGRTHLQHALPITFRYNFQKHVKRLEQVKESCLLVQFGGAASTLASLGTSDSGIRVRKRLATILSLQDPIITWHVARDTVAKIINYLTLKQNLISSKVILTQSKILYAQAGLVLNGMLSDFERASRP
ncbi:Trans-aconitate decarboxylase 1 [Colletotrichum shisoi]|uniref:Trans-aconitate decarboxylase 1 n=1 Tax=Colletotrichum shisoi TaxID=2078593 RepID=A0A5Q4C0I8_9PEZI|nr:Trans-aconitate decarboxylase 1 [Colletotrichum shisoi]